MRVKGGDGRYSNLSELMYALTHMYNDSPAYYFNGGTAPYMATNMTNLAAHLCNNAKNLNGSFEVVFRPASLPGAGTYATLLSFSNNAAQTFFQLAIDENGRVIARFVNAGAPVWSATTTNVVIEANKIYHLFFSNPAYGATQKIYINGVPVPVTYAGAMPNIWLAAIAANITGRIGMLRQNGADSDQYNGEMMKIRAYNRQHTDDEVYALFLGVPPFSDVAAVMTEHLTPAAPGDWAGAGDVTIGGGEAALIGYLFTVAGTSTATEANAHLDRVVQAQKRYRFIYTVTETVAHDGTLAFDLVIGATVVALDHTAGTHYVEFISPITATGDDVVVRFISAGGATQGTYTVGNLRLIEIGCVASYDTRSITPGRWGDSMQQDSDVLCFDTNNITGLGGSDPPLIVRYSQGHKCTLFFKNIDQDTTFQSAIPGGYRINFVTVHNTSTGTNVTLNIDAGATSIVAAHASNFGTQTDCALANNLLDVATAPLFDFTVTDSGGGWGAGPAVVNVTVGLERFV